MTGEFGPQGVEPLTAESSSRDTLAKDRVMPKRSSPSRIVIITVLIVGLGIGAAVGFYYGSTHSSFRVTTGGGSIGLNCTKSNATDYMCEIKVADVDVDFANVDSRLISGDGLVVAVWLNPLWFSDRGAAVEPTMMTRPIGTALLVDNGDGRFGVGDDFVFSPAPAMSLGGYVLKLSGGGQGSAPMS